MLSNSWNVPVPLLVDDEYLSVHGEGEQPPEVPSRLGLFVSSCKLFEILHEILLNFYAEDSGIRNSQHLESDAYAQEIIGDVLSFNRRLDVFRESIPQYLRTTRTSHITISEKNSCVNLQQQVLYCRYEASRFEGLLKWLSILDFCTLDCYRYALYFFRLQKASDKALFNCQNRKIRRFRWMQRLSGIVAIRVSQRPMILLGQYISILIQLTKALDGIVFTVRHIAESSRPNSY